MSGALERKRKLKQSKTRHKQSRPEIKKKMKPNFGSRGFPVRDEKPSHVIVGARRKKVKTEIERETDRKQRELESRQASDYTGGRVGEVVAQFTKGSYVFQWVRQGDGTLKKHRRIRNA